MTFITGLLIYITIGITFGIFAEFKMKDDPEWTIDDRLIILAFWPLVLYAHTL